MGVLSDKLKALILFLINKPITQTHVKTGFKESGNQ